MLHKLNKMPKLTTLDMHLPHIKELSISKMGSIYIYL
jgi:hypothetical protein